MMLGRIAPRGARALTLVVGVAAILAAGYAYGEVRAEQARLAAYSHAADHERIVAEGRAAGLTEKASEEPGRVNEALAFDARVDARLARGNLREVEEHREVLWTPESLWDAVTNEEVGR